jgi:hypothetical protein
MRSIPLALAVSLVAHSAGIQETTVDEGTFVVLHDGTPIGRENFKIVQAKAPGTQAYRATSVISHNEERITTKLTTDSLGAPLTYEVDVKVGGRKELHLDASSGRPTRFSTHALTLHGESARDFVVGDNPLLLDANVFHQYYFATLMPRRAQFATLEPRTGTQTTLRFEERGPESLRLGRRTVPARHLALIAADGSTRDLWVDSGGRLLRVEIPAAGLVAQRDDLPG